MPRRESIKNSRNTRTQNANKTIRSVKNKSDSFKTPSASRRKFSTDDERLDQMHTKELSSNVAALSDSKIIEELESPHTRLQSTHIQPKLITSVVCSTPILRPETDDKVVESLFLDSVSLIPSDHSICQHSTTEVTELNHDIIYNTTISNQNPDCFFDPGIVTEDSGKGIGPTPLAISHYSEEVIVSTSHDSQENIIIEEIDILPNSESQPLNTSTPLASPSISTILQNAESENINSFDINTPTSSMCVPSPLNDDMQVDSIRETTDKDDSYTEEEQRKKKRKIKKKSDSGKIRKVNKSLWIDSKRKRLKNLGLSYVSRDGKIRSEKYILPPCDDHCRLKCKEKITEDIRRQVFQQYWSLGDRLRQWDFLIRWCEKIEKKRYTTEGPSKRLFSVKYYLPTMDTTKEKVAVCKTMFLNTFAVGEGVVRTALKKISDGDDLSVGCDKRGRHGNHPKIKNDDMIRSVSDHVKSFTPVESHYTRKESLKLYLNSDLTMTKMFKLYEEWVPKTELNRAKTLRQYTDIVNENFNIEFHRPKKDQCDVCIGYKNQPKPINKYIYEQYNEHIQNKDMARSLKNQDKLLAINSPTTTVTAAFDFQKVLSCPQAETSILYYKRKLNVFNFTIFDMGRKVGKCYMWHEGTAKRGANEVASCVYDFIKDQSSRGIHTINLYSDNCGGQNRNRIVFMMYLVAAEQLNVNITHRFLEKGHTQNENDSIHALIERCSRNKEIYTPDQWFALVRWAKETRDPYIVKEVATEDILDFKKMLVGKNWTRDEKNLKVMWSKIREIQVSSSEPDVLKYKYTFNETHQRIFVRRTQNRRRQNQPDYVLSQAYAGSLPIPNAKLTDLKYLCEHNIIPRQYHRFYNSLAAGDVNVSSSDEEE